MPLAGGVDRYPPQMRRLGGLFVASALAAGCRGGASSPPVAPPVSVTSPATIPASALAPSTALDLVHTFNRILGAANGPIFAFGARLQAGVATDGPALPPDLLPISNNAANAFSGVAQTLQAQSWPAAILPSINAVIAAINTFAADMQLLSSLAPKVFPDWQRQFMKDGSALNDAENAVRTLLGAPAAGAS